jgi:hypothetical protein
MLNWEGSDSRIVVASKFSFFCSNVHVATFPQSMQVLSWWLGEKVISGDKRSILRLRPEYRGKKELQTKTTKGKEKLPYSFPIC